LFRRASRAPEDPRLRSSGDLERNDLPNAWHRTRFPHECLRAGVELRFESGEQRSDRI